MYRIQYDEEKWVQFWSKSLYCGHAQRTRYLNGTYCTFTHNSRLERDQQIIHFTFTGIRRRWLCDGKGFQSLVWSLIWVTINQAGHRICGAQSVKTDAPANNGGVPIGQVSFQLTVWHKNIVSSMIGSYSWFGCLASGWIQWCRFCFWKGDRDYVTGGMITDDNIPVSWVCQKHLWQWKPNLLL